MFFLWTGLAVLLKLLLLVAGGTALVLALFYGLWLAHLHKRPLPPRFLRSVLVEFLLSLAVALLWPLGWLAQRPRRLRQVPGSGKGLRPVLLLHGYGMNGSNFIWFGRRLRRLGMGPLYSAIYFSPQSLERSAKLLARITAHVLRREGVGGLDIVAHSMGGLVSRYFIERLGGGALVKNLITIGTPHHGTALARYAPGPGGREMAPDGAFLRELGPPCPPAGVRYLSVYSTADQMVIPPESASLAAEAHPRAADLRMDGLGHLSLLVSTEVAAAVAHALARLEEGAEPAEAAAEAAAASPAAAGATS